MEPNVNTNHQVKSPENGATKPFKFNPFDLEFRADPYSTYQSLRSTEPVHWSLIGVWVLTSYVDVKGVLTDKRFGADPLPKRLKEKHQYAQDKETGFDALGEATSTFLFYMNPPDHTRLRGLVSKAFSLAVVESMRPQIQKVVNELLGKVLDRRGMDIISDLAGPLPVIVIANLLGIPTQDCHKLHEWSNDLSRTLDPLISLKEYESLNTVALQFREYISDLIAEREKKPQQDLISALIAARDQGDRLREDELWTICVQLFVTGEETTVNTIGNGLLALLHHPDQMEKLKQNPTLIPSATEELLRYESPVQFTGRYATENIEIGGKTIKTNERVLLCLGAANRDPAQFPDPDRLDITRRENRHLAFADGIHYCLGAALARVQAQIAINTLVQQLSNLELNIDKLEWRKNIYLRGLNSLPVTFTPSFLVSQ